VGGGGDRGLPTVPEANRLTELGVPVLCFFGEDEADTLCRDLKPPVTVVQMPEGHHFGGKYQEMAGRILAAVTPPAQVSTGSPPG
jgi:type IV secretory pathway VirJ component